MRENRKNSKIAPKVNEIYKVLRILLSYVGEVASFYVFCFLGLGLARVRNPLAS